MSEIINTVFICHSRNETSLALDKINKIAYRFIYIIVKFSVFNLISCYCEFYLKMIC